jgi:heme/copper-type cytochrome/quinol oxidase subunit 1
LRFADFCLLASVGLFVLGCLVGAGIRGETTAVPAHYHGTVGAVTLAYMLWARTSLERFGLNLRQHWLWRWQPLIYGLGITLMVFGLAWAGRLGVPRKAPHVETAMVDGGHHLAMGLAGVGGLLATAGAGIFVAWILAAIWKKRIY